jgi:PAS domain S-box-containing protein
MTLLAKARRYWSDLSLRKKGLIVVSIPLLPLLVTVFFSYQIHRLEEEARESVTRTLQVTGELRSVETHLIEAENAVHAYLLTHSPSWLASYQAAAKSLAPAVSRLDSLSTSPAQREAITRMSALVEERLLPTLNKTVAAPPDTADLDAWLDESADIMKRLREEVHGMEARGDRLLVERTSRAQQVEQRTHLIMLLGAMFGLVGGLLAVLLFTTGISTRVARLAQNAEKLAAGAPVSPVGAIADELGHLERSLEDASRLLQQRDGEIRATLTRLESASVETEDLYNLAPCGYHSVDATGLLVRANDTWLEWMGYRRDEVLGKLRIFDVVRPESVPLLQEVFRAFKARGWIKDLEFEMVRKDGTLLPVSLSATAITDSKGVFVASRSTIFDITARREAEDEVRGLNVTLEERMREITAANQELEAFSYSVSHDLRAPVRHVAGFAALLTKSTRGQLDSQSRRYLATISSAAARMGRLIDDLLAFSRMGRSEMNRALVDLDALVRDILRETVAETPDRQIQWRIGDLPAVFGDPSMLRLAVANLIANAVKYTGQRRVASIEIGTENGHGLETVLFVRDNGVGFDMTYASKLFGVFQRLHRADEFEGTGIGLASVRRIVHRHGGRTWAVGEVDRGATFYISLPRHEASQDENGAVENLAGGGAPARSS